VPEALGLRPPQMAEHDNNIQASAARNWRVTNRRNDGAIKDDSENASHEMRSKTPWPHLPAARLIGPREKPFFATGAAQEIAPFKQVDIRLCSPASNQQKNSLAQTTPSRHAQGPLAAHDCPAS